MALNQKKRNFVEDGRKQKADTSSQGTICLIIIFISGHQDVIDEGVKSVEFFCEIAQIVPD